MRTAFKTLVFYIDCLMFGLALYMVFDSFPDNEAGLYGWLLVATLLPRIIVADRLIADMKKYIEAPHCK